MPKQGKKGRKVGRNRKKCQRYAALNLRNKNKLRRVLRSCGIAFARQWVQGRGVTMPAWAEEK